VFEEVITKEWEDDADHPNQIITAITCNDRIVVRGVNHDWDAMMMLVDLCFAYSKGLNGSSLEFVAGV
jgi:hypothetical protein